MGRPSDQDLPEGTRLLERYSIIDRADAGGMATIYRAMDERLDRVVCVKLLRLELEKSGSTGGSSIYEATYSHFLQEALALSKLQHPNTLRIYDFGYLEDKRPYQISEYLDGGNLEAHVRHRGALEPEEIVAILDRVTGAVSEAHQHGIIHRDIKPSNILFQRVGEVLMPKLADFGIAQTQLRKQPRPGEPVEVEKDEPYRTTIALFSPRWAAPEQLCGAPEGPVTDVYGLALLTAYMHTGKPLFDDRDVRATFKERVHGDTLVAARLAQHGFKGDLLRALLGSLRAESTARLKDPSALFEAIRRAFGIVPTSMPPTVIPKRARADSVTLEVESVTNLPGAQNVPAVERVHQFGERRVRFIDIDEKLDFTFVDESGGEIRFRVTVLPANGSLNIKGLNCFVSKPEGRPTPAVTATADGHVQFVSSAREVIGGLTWSFGTAHAAHDAHASHLPRARVFVVDGEQMMVPYDEAPEAVALHLSDLSAGAQMRDGRDLIVLCRRR